MDVENWVQIAVAFIAAATTVCTALISMNCTRQQKTIRERTEKEKAQAQESKAIANGVKAILWILLENTYKDATEAGFISVDDLKAIDSVYEVYHTLGGNGTGTSLHKKIHDLPNERIKK